MFGKKKENINHQTADNTSVNVLTIPDIFYGGADPVIYHQEINNGNKKEKEEISLKSVEENKHQGIFEKKYFVYGGVAILFLSVVGVTGWYYYNQAKISKINQEQNNKIPLATNNKPESENQELNNNTSEVVNTTSTPAVEIVSTTPAVVTSTIDLAKIQFPKILTLDSDDLDSDSLTDIEEEIYSTDSGGWDTDSDGYYDGLEVINLYNPKGQAPVKIIDSGLVADYLNSKFNYRVYYPNSWEIGEVDTENRHVIFSAITGDFVEIRSVEKTNISSTFEDWFSQNAPGESYTDLFPFQNRFSTQGLKRKDGLVYYFSGKNNVYVLIYHPGIEEKISFRHVFEMMAQSFRLDSNFETELLNITNDNEKKENINTTTESVLETNGIS